MASGIEYSNGRANGLTTNVAMLGAALLGADGSLDCATTATPEPAKRAMDRAATKTDRRLLMEGLPLPPWRSSPEWTQALSAGRDPESETVEDVESRVNDDGRAALRRS